MRVLFPITFDRQLRITFSDGRVALTDAVSEGDLACRFDGPPHINNGFDANGYRVTNLVGYNGMELIKWCPNCEEELVASEFGPEGRPDEKYGRRDQSWCMRCRLRGFT